MNKALFLDRDGVVNVDHGYVYEQENFEFNEGIFELCQKAQSLGYLIVIITNQSGIGRGLYTEEQFFDLTDWMVDRFVEQGVYPSAVYHCPHHPEKGIGEYKVKCDCRKPEPGMLLQAAEQLELSLSECIMVGDKESDIIAADRAGITKRFLISSHYHENSSILANHVAKISDVADQI